MKKLPALLLVLAIVFLLTACGLKPAAVDGLEENVPVPDTIYVLGPVPGSGWQAQAGVYGEQVCTEITDAGVYKATYTPTADGDEQLSQLEALLSDGHALGFVIMPLSDQVKEGLKALTDANIPYITFDRVMKSPDPAALVNVSGNHWQCGAGMAHWLQARGLKPDSAVLTLVGDDLILSHRRQAGFESFLCGELPYYDQADDMTYDTHTIWTPKEAEALCCSCRYLCTNHSPSTDARLIERLERSIAAAKAGDGRLYILAEEEYLVFSLLDLLTSELVSDTDRASLAALDVYIATADGSSEFCDLMRGTGSNAEAAETYFDDMMSVSCSPSLLRNAVMIMLDHISGEQSGAPGSCEYLDVWSVDKENADNYQGYDSF